METFCFMFVSANFLLLFSKYSNATETITLSDSIIDGTNSTLVSKDGKFEFGFFSPGKSSNRYLGIWYKAIPTTVVWVANRRNPISDTSGILMMNSTGNLVLVSENKSVVWSLNLNKVAQNPIVRLLDSGNLVLRDEKDTNSGNYLWQSFDYPSDTLLPGMKLGWDLKTGLDRRLSAWNNPDDPSPADFTWGIVLNGNPEGYIWKGSVKYYRSAPWNGLGNSGSPSLKENQLFEFSFVDNENEVYYMYNLKNKSVISRIVLNQTGYSRQRYAWNEETRTWRPYSSVPRDACDAYGLCGPYGNCILTESPVCQCLKGFTPASPENWKSAFWSDGCKRNNLLKCENGEGFVKFVGLKLPDTTHSFVNRSMNLKECRVTCLQNCSCTAYTTLDIRGRGSGCAMWFGDLIDMRLSASGQDLYIRMSASDLEAKVEAKVKIPVIIATTIAIGFGMLIIGYYIRRSRANLREKTENKENDDQEQDEQPEDLELPLFDLIAVSNATNKFSIDNKLGEGGFGPVYKGTLEDGQEIAVKRLSRSSGQGLKEFKNEVILIAKLQHRNLVKLLGCCIQGDEKMLIYEYMPNKSLDNFIFDQMKGKLLDWSKRFNIICGIARGLLYLHQDSRLRIVHRDLKASNVLLDQEMNPKISDFGMAKTFGGDQTEGNTNRVVGTYGYMAPEYASDGLFSTKSDVFSFGILLLEIISGKRSRGFYHPSRGLNLIGHAWTLWKEGEPSELIDPFLEQSCNLSEVIRCIQISLLCVQQHPEERPSMASVVLMLGGEKELPQPQKPGFFKDRGPTEANSSSDKLESNSTNEITFSLEAR
ncbi:hypothetical protein P3X46_027095 [Hevea brasiliensis]|uniref:Receptor-like serine/threonine-protein kinase n=2 Tax=Hevea brasiliensis TaxID=3981 RepID=A0ABQ9KYR2_HEVBR|nr:G-type lectin S-receptor-like serine/threonine-protein kinase At4g27290 isoform X1 [Hevea brasiliensis]KAJ9153677.1 hypothetical protein P3X46_027095 [Hevea brasiliensis]